MTKWAFGALKRILRLSPLSIQSFISKLVHFNVVLGNFDKINQTSIYTATQLEITAISKFQKITFFASFSGKLQLFSTLNFTFFKKKKMTTFFWNCEPSNCCFVWLVFACYFVLLFKFLWSNAGVNSNNDKHIPCFESYFRETLAESLKLLCTFTEK